MKQLHSLRTCFQYTSTKPLSEANKSDMDWKHISFHGPTTDFLEGLGTYFSKAVHKSVNVQKQPQSGIRHLKPENGDRDEGSDKQQPASVQMHQFASHGHPRLHRQRRQQHYVTHYNNNSSPHRVQVILTYKPTYIRNFLSGLSKNLTDHKKKNVCMQLSLRYILINDCVYYKDAIDIKLHLGYFTFILLAHYYPVKD